MKKLCATSIVALLTSIGAVFPVQTAAAKLSKAECGAIWDRAGGVGGGSLTPAEVQPYVNSFSKVDANADGQLSSGEFMSACSKGLIHESASTGASEGTSGEAESHRSHAPKGQY